MVRRSALFMCAALAGPIGAAAAQEASGVASGRYECWAFNTARMDLNFTVTGPGRYEAADGSTGTFAFDSASGIVAFEGYLGDVMPEGFTTVYHEPGGKPTVSFRSARGAEASFCEHT